MAVGSGIQVFLLKTIISDGLPPVFRGKGGLDITMTGRLDFTEEGVFKQREWWKICLRQSLLVSGLCVRVQ